jgi:hypothetical protein
MTAFFLLLAPLLIQLAAIYLLSGYVNKALYRRLGKAVYLLIMWPGVMVHELSHLAACLLTFTKVVEVRLFAPHEESPGMLVLGYVRHARPRDPVSAMLIGAAPFFGGAAALWAGMKAFFPSLATGGSFTPAALLSLVALFDWRAWTTYVFIYLVLTLSSHIAPSKPDIVGALKGVVGLFVLIAIFSAIDRYFALSTGAAILGFVSGGVGAVTALLSYGSAFVLLLAAIVFGIEAVMSLAKR